MYELTWSGAAQDWSREAVLEMRRIAFILDKMYRLATTAPLLYMLMYFLYYIIPSVAPDKFRLKCVQIRLRIGHRQSCSAAQAPDSLVCCPSAAEVRFSGCV